VGIRHPIIPRPHHSTTPQQLQPNDTLLDEVSLNFLVGQSPYHCYQTHRETTKLKLVPLKLKQGNQSIQSIPNDKQ